MTKPIARLHALEMAIEVIIADIAVRSKNGDAWLHDRKSIVLTKLADAEKDERTTDGTPLWEIHDAAAEIFKGAEAILAELRRPAPDVG